MSYLCVSVAFSPSACAREQLYSSERSGDKGAKVRCQFLSFRFRTAVFLGSSTRAGVCSAESREVFLRGRDPSLSLSGAHMHARLPLMSQALSSSAQLRSRLALSTHICGSSDFGRLKKPWLRVRVSDVAVIEIRLNEWTGQLPQFPFPVFTALWLVPGLLISSMCSSLPAHTHTDTHTHTQADEF